MEQVRSYPNPRLALHCAILLAGLVPAFSSSAQVPLIADGGGTVGFGTECLSPNDDGSSLVIPLAEAFPSGVRFFDRTHTNMYVNTNGNITFSGSLRTYTPRSFPVADQPMIAPYWADVDIRGSACRGSSGSGGCANPTSNGVWWQLQPGRVMVTWHDVGYFSCSDDLKMSFQLILTAVEGCGGEGDFDVEFRFNRCEWTTGNASGGTGGFGGTPAQAGFDAGNTRDFVMIPGSRTGTIHTTMCTMSNVGMPGIWRYQIRSGAVICPDAGMECDTGGVGVCAEGRTQCVGMGTECQPVLEASDERCDALDNDCDGMTDEGESICGGSDSICDRGTCVDYCFEGGCPTGQVCREDGRCVDEGCEDIECDTGTRCRMGVCVDACEGVICPHGLSCLGGRCLNLCESLMCDDCSVCVEGACEPSCEYRMCPEGQICLEDGHCLEGACMGITCPEGTHCVGGACVDNCEGAVCPEGEMCEMGRCVPEEAPPPPPIPDGGMMMSMPDGSPATPDATVMPMDPDCPPGFSCADASVGGGDQAAGCACAAVGHGREFPATAWLALGLFGVMLRRRRG